MPVMLISCPNLDSYLRVAGEHQHGTIPILAGCATARLGFPADTEIVSYGAMPFESEVRFARAPDPQRLCVSLREPACQAIGTYLAGETGRTLLLVDAPTFARALDEALELKPISLTLIVPGWCPDGTPDSTWIARSLIEIRRRGDRVRHLPWGLLTGAHPSAASLLAAKAILQKEIIAAYSQEPALVFTTATREYVGSTLPPPGAGSPIQHIDATGIRNKTAVNIIDQRWSLIFFSGHGRSYCGCQGYLCGARRLDLDPASVAERCVLGMDCASPADNAWAHGFPAFPRIDPRRYDTPFMVMDACGAGAWAFPTWQQGIPSVSYHAAAGAPSAIITGDQVTMHQAGSFSDVLWALTSARTAGEAVACLNDVRKEAAAEWPYYLVGDPELPCGSRRWPSWVGDAEVLTDDRTDGYRRLSLRCPIGPPFTRVSLASSPWSGSPCTISVSGSSGVLIRNARLFPTRDRSDLWLSVAADHMASCVQVTVEQAPSPRLPAGLIEAALRIPAEVRGWHKPLRQAGTKMEEAADLVLRVAKALDRTTNQAVIGRYDDMPTSCELAVQSWMDAHRTVLNAAMGFAGSGLWPFRLWSMGAFRNRAIDKACPYCGVAPTLHRIYDRFPADFREQWECSSCCLLHDRPSQPAPTVRFRIDEVLRRSTPLVAEVTIGNEGGRATWMGHGAIFVDGYGHNVTASPVSFELCVQSGGRITATATLSQQNDAGIHHRYWARSLLLLNGIWFLCTRPIILAPD
jgi:hypothetical protein